MENNIRCCYVHGNDTLSFCTQCKRLVCDECVECRDHKKTTIFELVGKYNQLFEPSTFSRYNANIAAALAENGNKAGQAMQAAQSAEMAAKYFEQVILASEEGRRNDIDLSNEATAYLMSVGEKSYSGTLREASRKAVELFNIEEKLNIETEGYNTKLELKKRDLIACHNKIKQLNMERTLLSKIMAKGDTPADGETKLALVLSVLSNAFKSIAVEPTFVGYSAFPGVENVFDIEAVYYKKMVDVGRGIKISMPTTFQRDLRGGSEMFASVSPKGMLAICSRGGVFYKVQFTDLKRERQCEMKVEYTSNVGFYDDSFVLLTIVKDLRYGEVEAVFEKSDVSVLNDTKISDMDFHADVSMLNSTRTLFLAKIKIKNETYVHIPFKYDVDTKSVTKLDVCCELRMFMSLTGIETGVKSVFTESDGKLVAYPSDTRDAFEMISRRYAIKSCAVLPSASEPTSLVKAMKLYQGNVFILGEDTKYKFKEPIKTKGNNMPIRLYQDIFLTFDKLTKEWVVIRIFVP